MDWRQWAVICLLGGIWGSSFFFGKVASEEAHWMTVVMVRVVIAALVLNAILLLTGQRLPREGKLWGWFFVMGLTNNLLPFSLIFWAMSLIPSGLDAILNATTPLFGVLIGHFITRSERLTPLRIAGVLFGLAGVAVMLGPRLLHGPGGDAIAEIGVLTAAALYAASGFYGRRFASLPPLIPATGSITASALMMVPVTLVVAQPWRSPPHSLAVLGSLLSLGLISTALAYVLYFQLLRTAGAGNTMLVTFLIPVSATILGCLFLDEQLGVFEFVGMGLVFLGLAAIDGRAFGWLRRRAKRDP